MPGKRKISFMAVVAFLYSGMFLYTGVVKLLDSTTFRADLEGSPLVPLSGWLVWVVPVCEMVLAGVLLVPRWRRWTMPAAVVLMAVFTIFFLFLAYGYPSASCSCGGFIQQLGTVPHALFNLAFIILGLFGIARSRAASNILHVHTPPAAGKGIADSL